MYLISYCSIYIPLFYTVIEEAVGVEVNFNEIHTLLISSKVARLFNITSFAHVFCTVIESNTDLLTSFPSSNLSTNTCLILPYSKYSIVSYVLKLLYI